MQVSRNTHQTTIRFSAELWRALEEAAARAEMSVAQYVREAARERLVRESHAEFPRLARAEQVRLTARQEVTRSYDGIESSTALWHQGHLARERARKLCEEARELRAIRRGLGAPSPGELQRQDR